jgi:hypothetical protein
MNISQISKDTYIEDLLRYYPESSLFFLRNFRLRCFT